MSGGQFRLNKNGGNMSSLVVISFDSSDEAEKVLDSLKGQTKYNNISFEAVSYTHLDVYKRQHCKRLLKSVRFFEE